MGRIISIILIAATIAFSASWCVHSDGGNDAWPGTSPDSAFATLGAATTSMSPGDSCLACGAFHETLTLLDGSHEGCAFIPWPDSGSWTIDGDTVRYCIYSGTSIGYNNEPVVIIRGMNAIDGADWCVNATSQKAGIVFESCSLDTKSNGIWTYIAYIELDSCFIHTQEQCIRADGSTVRIANSILESDSNYCVYNYQTASILESCGNGYFGYGGVYGYKGLSAIMIEDSFRVRENAIYLWQRPPQSFSLKKCLFVGSKYGIYTVSYSGSSPLVSLSNCTFDSVDYAVYLSSNTHYDLFVSNSVIAHGEIAFHNIHNFVAEGLVIYDFSVDTEGVITPIDYYTFDPQLDSAHVATADSAKMVGVNTAFGRDAPLWDDRGYWFRDDFGTPAIGWRSPYTDTGWPDTECDIIAKKWGIRSPGRRLK